MWFPYTGYWDEMLDHRDRWKELVNLFLIGGWLQCYVVFCHTSTWISHRYTYVPSLLSLLPTSHLPPHITPLGCHRALGWAPCIIQQIPPAYVFLHQWAQSCLTLCDPMDCSTPGFHMVMYMFPCYSLHSSHPLLPPLGPQVCSLCLHLHCCPANKLISTIFLDSIYMH